MINFLDELLNKHDLNLNNVVFVVGGMLLEMIFFEKYDVCYDYNWGLCISLIFRL